MVEVSLKMSCVSDLKVLKIVSSVTLRRIKRRGLQSNLIEMCGFILALVLLHGTNTVAGDSGIQYFLTPEGVSEFADAGIRSTLKDVLDAIPNFLRYDLSARNLMAHLLNLEVKGIQVPRPTVTLNSKGLKVEVSGLSMKLEGYWRGWATNNPMLEERGIFSTSVSGVNISVFVKLVNERDRLTTIVNNCGVSIGRFVIDFGGRYNSIARQSLRDQIKADLQDEICSKVQVLNKFVAEKLSLLKMEELIRSLSLDYSLAKNVTIFPSYVQLSLKGRFLGDVAKIKSIPMDMPKGGMMGLTVSEEVFNSRLRAEQNGGWNEDSFVRELWDGISETLPSDLLREDKPCKFRTYLPSPPAASISPSGIQFNSNGILEITPEDAPASSNSSLNFTFVSTARMVASLSYDSRRLIFETKSLKLVLNSPKNSELNLTQANEIIDYHLENAIKSERRKYLWELPLFENVSLRNASLTSKAKYLSLFSDFHVDVL